MTSAEADSPDVRTVLGRLKLDRTRQSAAQVFECLRQAIIEVKLVPGTLLQRAELAEHFGLSQTPIRDALQLLGAEGLVDIFPQHATVVSRIDLTAAQEAHYVRKAIELELLHTICQLPADAHTTLMQRLARHLAAQEAALVLNDLSAMLEADQAFHREMYEAAHMPALWTLVRKQSGHVDRLRQLHLPAPGKAQAVLADHRAIFEALQQKEESVAQTALRQHLAGTLSFVDGMQARYPDWITQGH
jgi:GntR family transcriptional regulator, rspAB operon transcriptional repressor